MNEKVLKVLKYINNFLLLVTLGLLIWAVYLTNGLEKNVIAAQESMAKVDKQMKDCIKKNDTLDKENTILKVRLQKFDAAKGE